MKTASFQHAYKAARTEEHRRMRVQMDARARAFLSALLHPLRGLHREEAMRSAAQHLKQQISAEFGDEYATSLFGKLAGQSISIGSDCQAEARERVFAERGLDGLKGTRLQADGVRA